MFEFYTKFHLLIELPSYIYAPPRRLGTGEGIYGCHSHNAKLFERIKHSAIR